ncbi:MAG: hypothetical protein AAF564_09445 [Bacteroidota bacterium]
MAESSPPGSKDPKTDLSEEELDDFLAGAGTVSKDALPNPELILGDDINVPVVAGPTPLVKQVPDAKPVRDNTVAGENATLESADSRSKQTADTGKTVSAQNTPSPPTEAPPSVSKRKFSLRRLFGLKTRN